MRPFYVVVQRATNHAWENTGSDLATLVAVLVDTKVEGGLSADALRSTGSHTRIRSEADAWSKIEKTRG